MTFSLREMHVSQGVETGVETGMGVGVGDDDDDDKDLFSIHYI